MSRLTWENTEDNKYIYETGVKNGVLFKKNTTTKKYNAGVAWNGLTAVTESPEGAEITPLYADDKKFLNLMSVEDFKATIEAYMYPDEFKECNGEAELTTGVSLGQQPRAPFGFSYTTTIGDADAGTAYGYKIHLVYECLAAPSERANSTINDSPEAMTMSWEVSTTPVPVTGHKPTAHLVIDSTKFTQETKDKLTAFEDILYGTTDKESYLPTPDEVLAIITTGELPEAEA